VGSKLYFFRGDKYARYDIASDKVDDGYPLSTADNWPGMREAGFADSIDAALNGENGKLYFFKRDTYIRYDVESDKVDDGYPLSIADNWPGMRETGFADSIDAALNWENGKVYFFKGDKYVRYDLEADKVDDGYPLAIADNWRGMGDAGFGGSIDAAVNWLNGGIYFFKGDRYVRYNIAADKVDDGYPLVIGSQWPGMTSAGFTIH
jgi:hypothetical protein